MDQSASLNYFLALQKLGFGAGTLRRLRATIPDLEKLWNSERESLATTGISEQFIASFIKQRKEINIEQHARSVMRPNQSIIDLDSAMYPLLLRETVSPPLVLYVRGNASLLQSRCLTVVGTRMPSWYGVQVTQRLLEPVAKQGVTIVSGLAFGIDAAAHESALAAHGKTVAVLGSGIDLITPVGNHGLGVQILESGGALISEYPPGTQAQRHHFPQRNRILAGLSAVTLVVEAGPTSGALITAKMALEEGRDVFAVPGPITSSTSAGTNDLIKHGAAPATSADDLIQALGLDTPAVLHENIEIEAPTGTEATILALLHEPHHVDELVAMSTLDASTVNAILSILELRGRIRHLGGMNYIRTH